MSDLAFDMSGDPIVLPASAHYWRVRRFRNPGKQGAPEVVMKDDAPLILPLDTGFMEFRELVEDVPGRYRLDALDDKRKLINNAPAAYLTLAEPLRNSAPVTSGPSDGPDTVLRELARANVEMARVNAEVSRNIADRFAGIMQAAAEVIRAADGAGIVARQPPVPATPNGGGEGVDDDSDDDEEAEDVDGGDAEAKPWLGDLVQMVMPALGAWLEVKFGKPAGADEAANDQAADQAGEVGGEAASPKPAAKPRNASPTPAQLIRLAAIKKLLTPQEGEVALATAMQLSPEDREELLAELEKMTIEEGAAFVRSLLPQKMKGAAS